MDIVPITIGEVVRAQRNDKLCSLRETVGFPGAEHVIDSQSPNYTHLIIRQESPDLHVGLSAKTLTIHRTRQRTHGTSMLITYVKYVLVAPFPDILCCSTYKTTSPITLPTFETKERSIVPQNLTACFQL